MYWTAARWAVADVLGRARAQGGPVKHRRLRVARVSCSPSLSCAGSGARRRQVPHRRVRRAGRVDIAAVRVAVEATCPCAAATSHRSYVACARGVVQSAVTRRRCGTSAGHGAPASRGARPAGAPAACRASGTASAAARLDCKVMPRAAARDQRRHRAPPVPPPPTASTPATATATASSPRRPTTSSA